MSSMADVSEFIAKAGYGSESEGDEAAESRITLAQDMGRGNLATKQSRVKLHEVMLRTVLLSMHRACLAPVAPCAVALAPTFTNMRQMDVED